MVILEFSVFPVGAGESLSAYVGRSLDIIDRSGLEYRLTPMGTILEGEWGQVLGVVKQCFEAVSADCNRVYASIKVDYRKGEGSRLQHKVEAVERQLGRALKK